MRYEVLPAPAERLAAISLDLEEDHGGLSKNLRYEALSVLPAVLERLHAAQVPLSVFVAGNFLRPNAPLVRSLAHLDFHSHGWHHPPIAEARRASVRAANIQDGLRAFTEFFGRPPLGYRAPFGLLGTEDFRLLAESKVRFDSSFFPGPHVSGFYPFRVSRPHRYPQAPMTEVPISAHPLLRLACTYSYLRLFSRGLFERPAALLANPMVFNFHLHDLITTSVSREAGRLWQWVYGKTDFEKGFGLLAAWIAFLRRQGYRFISMTDLYRRVAGETARG